MYQLRLLNQLTAKVSLKIQYIDYIENTTQIKFLPTDDEQDIVSQASELFDCALNRRIRVISVGSEYDGMQDSCTSVNCLPCICLPILTISMTLFKFSSARRATLLSILIPGTMR